MRRTTTITNNDLLSGWKKIAVYLDCSIRHAQRFEKDEGLPVFRPEEGYSHRPPVFASKRSIDLWWKGTIESVVLTDDQLLAFGKGSRPLWAHRFAERLRGYTREELAWRLQIVRSGNSEEKGVLAAVQFKSGDKTEKLRYFGGEGELVWEMDVDPLLKKADGSTFENAWTIKHMIVISDLSGPSIWVALANSAGWGGCILRIAMDGSATVKFSNAGHVERLGLVTIHEEKCLIFCGENNDYDCAFVALLGLDDPVANSVPGKRTVYRFCNAPRGRPRKLVLFPSSEMIAARKKPYGHATDLQDYTDRLVVQVETGGDGACFLYHFTLDLEPMYVFPSGSHEIAHKALERKRAIGHSWVNCPERKKGLQLRIWTGSKGWRDRTIRWRDNPWKDD